MNWPIKQTAIACLIAPWLWSPNSASAMDSDTGLPPPQQVIEVLTRAAPYQAALKMLEAEKAVQRQYQLGPQEWTVSLNAARRNQNSPTSEKTTEWEFGLDRGIRLPGKAQAQDGLGQARLQLALTALNQTWREQTRLLLERQANWLREREAARIWSQQIELLREQAAAIDKRQRLGDAARIDQLQAAAALLQAQAQFNTANSKALAAREALQNGYPGLDITERQGLPALQKPGDDEAMWLDTQLAHSPELALARQDALAAQAQTRLDTAEQHPDPTIGVRLGRARDGAESTVGLVLSVPIGGAYRSAVVSASASRQAAAQWAQTDAEQRARTQASLRWREAISSYEAAMRHGEAAQRLSDVATGLTRGYQLGEGTLNDVLMARRLANEQQLIATAAAVEAWLARHRLALEADQLWAAQPTPKLSASETEP